MKYLQDTNNSESPIEMSHTLRFFHLLNFLFIVIIFALNFAGSPTIKFVYLGYIGLILICTFSYTLDKILPEIITLLFLEGQGRLVWEYQSWSRIIFDLICLLSILRIFIINKKFYNPKVIPLPIIVIISLHIVWYMVQFTNVNSASLFGVIGALKIYIFPIFLFLGLTLTKISIKSKHFYYFIFTFVFVLVLELILNYYQTIEREKLVFQISQYYYTATRDGVFTKLLYRPFATTPLPGALSIFIFLTIGFMYLYPTSWKKSFFRLLIVGFSIFNLIICQVRSALVKYILILFLIYLGDLIFHRFKFKKVVPLILSIFLTIYAAQTFLVKYLESEDENIAYSVERATSLADTGKMKSQRIDIDTFFNVLIERLTNYPFGVGPGMTGAASSINQDFLATDPLLNNRTLWTYDNLYISLFIDLGIGAFNYIFLVLLIPAYFFKSLLLFYRDKLESPYLVILVCFSTQIVIIIGNWGALGLPYNPESFIFWFIAALGFLTIAENQKNQLTNETEKHERVT
jgi:hypothetical protein